MRIITALLAALIVVAIGPLLFLHQRLTKINREALETAEMKYLQSKAVMISTDVASYVRTTLGQLQRTADGFRLANSLVPNQNVIIVMGDEKRQSVMKYYAEAEPNVLVLWILDREGAGGQVMKVDLLDAPVEAALRRGFEGALRGSNVIGEPVRSAALKNGGFGDGGFVVAVPIVTVEGQPPVGAIVTFISLSPIKRWLEDEKKRDVTAYIVDKKGKLVLTGDVASVPFTEPLQQVELVAEFMKASVRLTRSYVRGQGESVRRVLGTVSPVETLDWGVIAEKEESKAFASVSEMKRESSTGALLGILVAAVVAMFAARLMSRPVVELAHKVRLIADGNLTQRVAVRGARELAELSESFNSMTDSLEKTIEKLRLAVKENAELFINSIRTLAAAIDAKDPYTRGHSERVARYAVAIGRHYGLPPEEIKKLRIAALLHDVGKIGIDDKILRKPTALTDEEFEVMKTHPTKGAIIIGQIPQLADVLPGIKHHHEKWDGTGYPEGLSYESIPTLARLVTVADTFDAMTTTRPYQKAMATDYVVARIRSFSGTRFDPQVVLALEKAYEARDIEVVGETPRLAVSA